MISAKIASIMAVTAFAAGAFIASPVPQAIASTIANDVQCTGCVGTSDLANNAVTSAKIKDGEVKAADIATDAVGARALQGVTKLLFAQCTLTEAEATNTVNSGNFREILCEINGVDPDDSATATLNNNNVCFDVARAIAFSNIVEVTIRNNCGIAAAPGSSTHIAVIVYDK